MLKWRRGVRIKELNKAPMRSPIGGSVKAGLIVQDAELKVFILDREGKVLGNFVFVQHASSRSPDSPGTIIC
jgi:hypothetical protein